MLRGESPLTGFTATLTGIPTPGPGRWFALLIAGSMAIGGVFAARGAFDGSAGGKDLAADKKRARELLLRELVALEAARRFGAHWAALVRAEPLGTDRRRGATGYPGRASPTQGQGGACSLASQALQVGRPAGLNDPTFWCL